MPQDNLSIIADEISTARLRRIWTVVFACRDRDRHGRGLIYARADLTLSHYDARAHLVVARRVVDSLTPGWRQLGGVWLPLPHLVNLVPVQWDWAYRTGATGVAGSILVLSWGLAALAGVLYRAHRFCRGRTRRPSPRAAQSECPVSAEHANDRAVADRHGADLTRSASMR